MRAVVILGPNASSADLRPFQSPDVELTVGGSEPRFDNADAVLVLGGDGTVHRHLAALSAARIPVLMVPLGSGNDFARALGINRLRRATMAWSNFCAGVSNTRVIDLGLIRSTGGAQNTETYFCCVGGAGLDAEANRRANAMPRWLRARGGYLLAVLGAVATFRALPFEVLAIPCPAGETQQPASPPIHISEPGLMVAFANGPAYGGGMRIAPAAEFADGQLDVCFVRQTGKLRLLRLLPTVFSGGHVRLKEVEYFKATRLRVETEIPLEVYADGEYICRTPVEVSIVPKALRVIVP